MNGRVNDSGKTSSPAKKKREPRSRDLFSSTRPYLIDTILPSECVHLLGGPSGAGKTRWMFQLIETWRKGESVFGFPSHPVPFVYIATDRSYSSVSGLLRSLGIDPERVPIFPAQDLEPESGYSINWLLRQIEKEFPDAKLLIIETIAAFINERNVNDYNTVGRFMRRLSRIAAKKGLTVLATHHASKVKGNERYLNPRDQLLGSGGGWSGFAETIFVMQFADESDVESPYRSLSISPRDAANLKINYKFNPTGQLVYVSPMDVPKKAGRRGRKEKSALNDAIRAFFDKVNAAGKFSFELKELLDAIGDIASKRTTIYRIEAMCDEGTLRRMAQGEYQIVGLQAGKIFEGVLQ